MISPFSILKSITRPSARILASEDKQNQLLQQANNLQYLLNPSVETPWRRDLEEWRAPSSVEESSIHPYRQQFLDIGRVAGIATGAWFAPKLLGKVPSEFWYKAVRYAEEFSPGAIFSTFRLGEALSPIVPKRSDILINISKLNAVQLTKTSYFFKNILGIQEPISSFKDIVFKPVGSGAVGRLEGITKAGRSVPVAAGQVFRAIRLGELHNAAVSVMAPGIYKNIEDIRQLYGGKATNVHGILPVTPGKVGKAKDYLFGARSYLAATVQRLSTLLESVGQEVRIPGTKYNLTNVLKKTGFSLTPQRGPALRSLLKFSGIGLKFGLGYLGLKSLDAMRTGDTSLPKHLLGIAGTTGVFSVLGRGVASVLKKNTRAGFMMGAAASLLQFTPGFNEGIIPGVAGLVPKLNLLRANIGRFTLASTWRRTVEDILPGASDPKTALFMGTLAASGAYLHRARKVHGTFLPWHRKVLPAVRMRQHELLGTKYKPTIPTAEITPEFKKTVGEIIAKGGHEQTLLQGSERLYTMEVARRIKTEALTALGTADDVVLRGNVVQKEYQRLLKGASAANIKSLGRGALVAGGLWYLAASGLGLGTVETVDELQDIYSGQALIPIKRGRAWEFGRTSYEGGDNLYYRQHWFPRLLAKARQEGQETYTPIEKTILKNFTYDMEKEQYRTRPYSITSQFGDQIPFIYPLIEPLARLIKPAKLMHVGEWARINDETGQIELKYRHSALDPTPSPLMDSVSPTAPVSPYESTQLARRGFYEISELSGLVGYAAQGIYSGVTGAGLPFSEAPILQSATEVRSLQNELWSAYTGGAFMGIPFMSEAVRRFLPATPSFLESYSPIQNAMPMWLPEELRYGDPYQNLRYGLGEERLPGPLYDELYGTGGDYSLEHKFRILADVASYSPEFRSVLGQAKAALVPGPESGLEAEIKAAIESQGYELRSQIPVGPYRIDLAVVNPYKPGFIMAIEADGAAYHSGLDKLREDEKRQEFLERAGWQVTRIRSTDWNQDRLGEVQRVTSEIASNMISAQVRPAPTVTAPSAEAQASMLATLGQYATKKTNLNYDFYRQGSGYGFYDAQGQLVDINEMLTRRGASRGPITRLWEGFMHASGKVLAPAEHMMPAGLSPWAKLVHQMDPVEQYEQSRVFGKELKMWESPWENWVRPALETASRFWLQDKDIPSHVQTIRETQQYYDMVKWYKYKKLRESALRSKKLNLAAQYEVIARSTQYGANPYSSASRVKYAIPYSERKYFDAFSMATSEDTQANILSLVPSEQASLYKGQWERKQYEALGTRMAFGSITEAGVERMKQIESHMKTEGQPFNPTLYAQYINSNTYMNYADWFRMKNAEAMLSMHGFPAPQWITFNPAVDLEDVKLRHVMSQGANHYDYDIFMGRVRALGRKPYLFSDEMDTYMADQRMNMSINPMSTMSTIRNTFSSPNATGNLRYSSRPSFEATNNIDIQFNVGNSIDISTMFN